MRIIVNPKQRTHILNLMNEKLVAIAACALAITLTAQAAEIIKPQIGEPLRDAAVTRGPDGVYYLTGSTATEKGKGDFQNCLGAHVWSSSDLKQWKDLGFVYDLRLEYDPGTNYGGALWQSELYPVPGLTPGERARGMTAPRFMFDGTRYWLTYSMNGYGAGALPSEGASIAGPYINTKQIVEAGGNDTAYGDASLFIEADGVHYLVWGGGCVAKLKSPEQMTADFAFAKGNSSNLGAVGVEGAVSYLPALSEGYAVEDGLPEHGAPYGVSVFRDGNRYAFLFSARTLRDGAIHGDSYLCQSDKLLGSYSKPQPFILDSGRVTLFLDADDKPRVSYSDAGNNPVIVAYPATLPSPSKAGAPKPKRGDAATQIPVPKPSEKPTDIKQLVEMIEPLFDHPLRDAALCYGPDGTRYLIGTEATGGKDGNLDWSNNNGIRLWSSTDQKTWKDRGYVWDCDRDGKGWHQEAHLDLTCGATPKIGRAITAPEMHCVKGAFYIVYSLNGGGIGILKSSSGKAEGPYQDLGRIVKEGRDGSLLVDGDTVYLVWGQGFYAKLNNDLTALAGPVKTLFTNVVWYPRYLRRLEVIGQWGSHIIKAGDWYIWTFTTRSGRLGNNSIDTVASWSKSLSGPWGEPCLMLANGGQSTLVAGTDGKYYATVSGEDEYAQLPYLAAITEVSVKPQDYSAKDVTAQFQAVNSVRATALDLWKGHPDLVPYQLRDVWMNYIDGYYYVTGSFWGVDEWANIVPLYRSKDMLHWEPLPAAVHGPGAIMKIEDFFGHPEWPMETYQAYINKTRKKRTELFDIKLKKHDGKYYSEVMVLGLPAFLSVADQIGGPYKPLRTIPVCCDMMADDDGSMVYAHVGWTKRYKDMEALIDESKNDKSVGRYDIKLEQGLHWCEDSEAGMVKIDGKYVKYCTDWTGSYDLNYMVCDTIEGPWRNLRVVPYGGNSYLFKDQEGQWWCAYFMNCNDYATRAGNFVRLNIMPLYVGWHNNGLIIEPKAVRTNRARLEKLGALWQGPRKD